LLDAPDSLQVPAKAAGQREVLYQVEADRLDQATQAMAELAAR